MSKSTVYIYTLEHPITGEIRYIGQTKNPVSRLWRHINELTATYKSNWIKSLLTENLKPIMKTIEEVSIDDWQDAEIYWIAQFKAWGFRLTNSSEGGEGGFEASKEFKEKLSNRFKGIPKLHLRKSCYSYYPNGKFCKAYNSMDEAAKDMKLSHPCYITECIKKNKLVRKLYWSYYKLEVIGTNSMYDLNGNYIYTKEMRKELSERFIKCNTGRKHSPRKIENKQIL